MDVLGLLHSFHFTCCFLKDDNTFCLFGGACLHVDVTLDLGEIAFSGHRAKPLVRNLGPRKLSAFAYLGVNFACIFARYRPK